MTSGSPPPPAPMYTKKMQEYCQWHGLDLPVYKFYEEEEDGPHHQSCRRCLYTATVDGLIFLSPWCASPKEAGNAAAKSVFDFITTNGPTSFLTAAPPLSPPSTSAPTGVLDAHMYKNILQEYTQKTLLELPSYHTVKVKEGPLHKPKFRCTVTVQNTPYMSPHTFAERKSAEQDAARIVLKCFHQNPKVQDTTFCKSILFEYAIKMHLDRPSYKTIREEEGLLPVFVSTVHFHGVSYYTRVMGKPRKETEQLAARFVIRNILDNKGNSESVKVMSRIIQSKFNTKDINSIFRTARSVVDSQVTSGIVDVVKKQADNLYLPNHISRNPKPAVDLVRKLLPNDIVKKQAGSDYLPIHPSKKRNLGSPKQAVDPGIEFIPSMHTLVEKLRARGKRG